MDLAWLLPLISAALLIIGGLWLKALTGYVGKKLENLATREDVAKLTREVETVKAEISEGVWNRHQDEEESEHKGLALG